MRVYLRNIFKAYLFCTYLLFLLMNNQQFHALGLKEQKNLSIKGSETMLELSYILTKYYINNVKSDVQIEVMGGGSGVGIISMINGMSDLANASRSIKEKEIKRIEKRSFQLKDWIIAIDAIMIYVNPLNKVNSISEEDIRKVYLGEIENWKELGGEDRPIILYGRESTSGTYGFFKKKLIKGKEMAVNIIQLAGHGSVINSINQDKGGIGYGAYTKSTKVKLLNINYKGKTYFPKAEDIKAKNYPFLRPLFIYALEHKFQQKPYMKEFIDWILSPSGQALIEKSGYFPVN